MRVLWVSDLHMSSEPPPSRTTRPFYAVALGKLGALVAKHRPAEVWLGGDLFHTRAAARPNPSLALIFAIRDWIDACLHDFGVQRIRILPGNHDVAFGRADEHRRLSPLRLLEQSGVVVYWTPAVHRVGEQDVAFVPYFADDLPLADALEGMVRSGRESVVCLHTNHHPHPTGLGERSVAELRAEFPAATLFLLSHIHVGCVVDDGDVRYVNVAPFVRRATNELTQAAGCGVLVDLEQFSSVVVSAPLLDDVTAETLHPSAAFNLNDVLRSPLDVQPLVPETFGQTLADWVGWVDSDVLNVAVDYYRRCAGL